MTSMVSGNGGYTRLEFRIPARGLIGVHNEFLTATHGTGILNHGFSGYEPMKGERTRKTAGTLIALESGEAAAYALYCLQERGPIFIDPGTNVYAGMIIGENSKEGDLVVNVCKLKKLTNMRSVSADEAIRLIPPRRFTLELALEYIEDDELLEVTPKTLRMRKKILDHLVRKRSNKS